MSGPGSLALCHVLREDRELAEAIPPERRRQAIDECATRELHIHPGTLPAQALLSVPGGVGLLVMEGLLLRRVGVQGRFGVELLGVGDLLRPWQDDRDSSPLALETGWSVLDSVRLAMLDLEFVQRLCSYPELIPAFMARAMQRSRNLAVNMAIVQHARVDVRLRLLLWHFAARWGRVHSDGTALLVRLPHALLAELVAARRQTVTTALSDLSRRGLVRSSGERWLLFGEPPGELAAIHSIVSRPSTPASHFAS